MIVHVPNVEVSWLTETINEEKTVQKLNHFTWPVGQQALKLLPRQERLSDVWKRKGHVPLSNRKGRCLARREEQKATVDPLQLLGEGKNHVCFDKLICGKKSLVFNEGPVSKRILTPLGYGPPPLSSPYPLADLPLNHL